MKLKNKPQQLYYCKSDNCYKIAVMFTENDRKSFKSLGEMIHYYRINNKISYINGHK